MPALLSSTGIAFKTKVLILASHMSCDEAVCTETIGLRSFTTASAGSNSSRYKSDDKSSLHGKCLPCCMSLKAETV